MPASSSFNFNTSLTSYLPNLHRYAKKLTRFSGIETNDLIQSTVLRALEKRAIYNHKDRFLPWLLAIMYHNFVNELRRTKKQPEPLDESELDKTKSIPACAELRVQVSEILAELQKLPKSQQDLMIYLAFNGTETVKRTSRSSYAEMSQKFNLPLGTTRSRISRARETLRKAQQT